MLTSFKKQITASMIAATFALSGSAIAAELEKIHFIIPGGAGGGWDMTARGTGDVLLTVFSLDQDCLSITLIFSGQLLSRCTLVISCSLSLIYL